MPAELATVDDSQFNARLSNETPIVGMTTLWDKSPIGAAYQDEYIAIAPMAGPNGDRGVASNIAISAYDCVPKFVMCADCENKEALMRFIDLCFIPENGVQCFYGPIGTVLEETEDYRIVTSEWGVTMKQFKEQDSTPEFLDFTVTTPEAWEKAKARMTVSKYRVDWNRLERHYAK